MKILNRALETGGTDDLGAFNQAWAILEGIDLGPDRRLDEVEYLLSGEAGLAAPCFRDRPVS